MSARRSRYFWASLWSRRAIAAHRSRTRSRQRSKHIKAKRRRNHRRESRGGRPAYAYDTLHVHVRSPALIRSRYTVLHVNETPFVQIGKELVALHAPLLRGSKPVGGAVHETYNLATTHAHAAPERSTNLPRSHLAAGRGRPVGSKDRLRLIMRETSSGKSAESRARVIDRAMPGCRLMRPAFSSDSTI
jgi:hypothetical protein